MSARFMRRAVWWIVGCVCFLPGCAAPAVKTRPPECHLPSRTDDTCQRFVLSSRVHYLQHDKRWAADPIGGSGKPLQRVGCAICCLSMALDQYGIDRTPGELNSELKQIGGYNERGWVQWNAVASLTQDKVHVEWVHEPTLADIEQALARRQPVLVKVAPAGMVQHWVLLTGRDGQELLMKDPLDATKSFKPLSTLDSEILAVRILKRGQGSPLRSPPLVPNHGDLHSRHPDI